MVKCEICQRELKTKQALGGHMRFKHNSVAGATGLAAGTLDRVAVIEDTLWLISTDVSMLSTDIQLQMDQRQEVLVSLGDQLDQLLASAQSASRDADSITQISAKLDELAATIDRQANQHKPGFCEERRCSANCHFRLLRARSDAVDIIDYKLPSTKQNLRAIELAMRTGDVGEFPVAGNYDLLDDLGAKDKLSDDLAMLEALGMGFSNF